MRRLLVVVIAMVTSIGVFAPSAYADARSDLLASYAQVDANGNTPVDPGNAAARWEAICAAQPGGVCPVSSFSMPTAFLATGTPSQVKGGDARFSPTCKSKVSCVVTTLGSTLAFLGLSQAEDWLQADAPPQVDWPVQTYASEWAFPCTSAVPVNTGSWNADSFQIQHSSGGTPPQGPGASCYSNIVFAADCFKPSTGERFHHYRRHPDQVQSHPQEPGYDGTRTVNSVCGASPTDRTVANGWVVERLHFTQLAADAPSVVNPAGAPNTNFDTGFTQGFYWGKEQAPAAVQSKTGCQRPDGTTYEVTTTAIGGAAGGVNVAACNAGDTPIWNEILSCPAGGGTCESQSVLNLRPAPAGTGTWPQCSIISCYLQVEVGGIPCSTGTNGCTNWASNKTNAKCYYGPYEVPIHMCYVLERAYESNPGPVPATRTNTDGDPDTHEGPTPARQPLPQPSPTVTRAPQTLPSPSPSTTATTSPNTDPTTRPQPTPTGSGSTAPSPGTGTNPFEGSQGSPNAADTASQKCFPSGWSAFNPVQWVLLPIRCAFEPTPALTQARIGTIKDTLAESGPAPAFAQVDAIVASIPSGGGCAGPAMSFSLNGKPFTLNLFSACEEPMATAASYARILASVVIVTTGVLSIARALSVAFGFNFSMGRGSSGD